MRTRIWPSRTAAQSQLEYVPPGQGSTHTPSSAYPMHMMTCRLPKRFPSGEGETRGMRACRLACLSPTFRIWQSDAATQCLFGFQKGAATSFVSLWPLSGRAPDRRYFGTARASAYTYAAQIGHQPPPRLAWRWCHLRISSLPSDCPSTPQGHHFLILPVDERDDRARRDIVQHRDNRRRIVALDHCRRGVVEIRH